MDDADEPKMTLEFRPAKPSPPPTLLIRRPGYQLPIVLSEEEAFEVYNLLAEHFG